MVWLPVDVPFCVPQVDDVRRDDIGDQHTASGQSEKQDLTIAKVIQRQKYIRAHVGRVKCKRYELKKGEPLAIQAR